jgi:hypothetical protein
MTHPPDFPCLICGKELETAYPQQPHKGQPYDGVVCDTNGNYGSRVYDPMDGSTLVFNICDECLVAHKDRLFSTRYGRPVRVSGGKFRFAPICGSQRVQADFKPWDPDSNQHDEDVLDLTYEQLIAGEYPDDIHWNVPAEILAGAYLEDEASPEENDRLHRLYPTRVEEIEQAYEDACNERKAQLKIIEGGKS